MVWNKELEQSNNHTDKNKPFEVQPLTWRFWRKRRYIVVLLAFFGFFNVYTLRINLSMGLVEMTENHTVIDEHGNETWKQEFPWNSKEKGLVLSSFFYGYITTQLIGGILAAKYGGNIIYATGIGMTSFLTLLTPWAAKQSIQMLVALRIIEGVFEGVTYPSIHAVWARWAPPLERSRMAATAFAGAYVGNVVAMPACGLLTTYFGWESIFYVFGGVGCIWFIFWICIVRAGPEYDKFCSNNEREYIQHSIGIRYQKKIQHPWKAIFTSKPFLAIVSANVSENWGFHTMMTQLPTFLKSSLGFDLKNAGFLSALPYLTMSLFLTVAGYFADWFQTQKILNTTQVRRYFNCAGFFGQGVFMLLSGYVIDPFWSIFFITAGIGVGAFTVSGYGVNHLDIAPQHASVLLGLANTVGTVPGIVSPLLTGFIVVNQTNEEWRLVFFIASAIYLIGCTIYWFWASGELQDWAKPTAAEKNIEEQLEMLKTDICDHSKNDNTKNATM